MRYELNDLGNGNSTLEILRGDYAKVAGGQRRHEHSLEGDNLVFAGIKKLAEAA